MTVSKSLEHRIGTLSAVGQLLDDNPQQVEESINKAYRENRWFTPEFSRKALQAIKSRYLYETNLKEWLSSYTLSEKESRIGLICAGNIPLVGWHDLMCIYLSGHQAAIKFSSKDQVLTLFLLELLYSLDPSAKSRIGIVERLKDYDAVIATGSNNSARYFEEYFGHVPNIIRKNRNAIAVLHGDETKEEIVALGKDIFTYFGLGCRNVSKLYVPKDYDFHFLLETLHDEYKEMVMHHKYKNNFDYNHALFMLNKETFLMNGCLLLKKSDQIPSRIASLHYSHYENLDTLSSELSSRANEIQCIVSQKSLEGHSVFPLGKAQEPGLSDYADGVDTMAFLTSL